MQIEVKDSAREFLSAKGFDSVTIGTKRGSGWGCGNVPFVEMGKPTRAEGWLEVKRNNISVYYRDGLQTTGEIIISAGGPWIFKALSVTGIRL